MSLSLAKMVLLMVKNTDKSTLSMCSPTIQLNLTHLIMLKLQTAYKNGVREDTHAMIMNIMRLQAHLSI